MHICRPHFHNKHELKRELSKGSEICFADESLFDPRHRLSSKMKIGEEVTVTNSTRQWIATVRRVKGGFVVD